MSVKRQNYIACDIILILYDFQYISTSLMLLHFTNFNIYHICRNNYCASTRSIVYAPLRVGQKGL